MLQGTSSSVGKSLMVTGLCRLLTRQGFRVAPFKAQNMALNSYVTSDGGEIGRAQAIQAEACKTAATTDMNPILLKPEAERRSQVVVKGKVLAGMSAQEYHAIKPQLRHIIVESLTELRRHYDVVVIEGAGSPAEINLKDNDLVNMFVARSAKAPVLLIGDIDRGGVFAAFVGTLELLTLEERALVRGFVVNKFRGDIELLKPGLTFLEERSGIPVTGVMPYIKDLRIGDEDSLALDDKPKSLAASPDKIDIAVLRYPRISNYDEFNALEHEPSVHLSYVQSAHDLERADFVILPGSKSVMSDLTWLRANNLEAALQKRIEQGKPTMGICGGYQMLTRTILDPHLAEGEAEAMDGLGHAPYQVVFQKHKVTCQVRASAKAFSGSDDLDVAGYEIHMGDVIPLEPHTLSPLTHIAQRGADGRSAPEGYVSTDRLIRGTLVHGLFENENYRQNLLAWLWERRGQAGYHQQFAAVSSTEDAYDRLADIVAEHLDMAAVHRLLAEQRPDAIGEEPARC